MQYIYFCHCRNPVRGNENQQNIKGGVAIAIRKTYNNNIYQINRIDKRIIEIRLKTGKSIKNISILNSYAPHMSYDKEEIKEYWARIQKYIDTIPNNLIKMWRADNNGQIAQNDTCNSIGKWTIANADETGNDGNFLKH